MDTLAKFQELKIQIRKGETIAAEISELETEIKHLEKFISLLDNGTSNENKLMLMLSMNTPETGKVHLTLSNALYQGLSFGLKETMRTSEIELRILKDKFDEIISAN